MSQRIDGRRLDTPDEVVRWMGALQAQDYQQSLWAIGARTRSATVSNVEQAIGNGRILRTWPMRGTIHFVPRDDARWMLELSASRMIAADRRRQAQLELDETILKRSARVVGETLKAGQPVSRPAVMAALEAAGISTRGQRGYHILWYLSQTGLTCLGPMLGKQPSFVLLDAWAPHGRDLSREQALAELANRYVQSHGPATVHDFAGWAGLTVGDARAGLESARPACIPESIGGKDYWVSDRAGSDRGQKTSAIHLLAGFDEFLLGYKERREVLDPAYAGKIVPGGNGVFFPIIVMDGRVVGTWKRKVTKGGVQVQLDPFEPVDINDEELHAAAVRYAAFLGQPLVSVQ